MWVHLIKVPSLNIPITTSINHKSIQTQIQPLNPEFNMKESPPYLRLKVSTWSLSSYDFKASFRSEFRRVKWKISSFQDSAMEKDENWRRWSRFLLAEVKEWRKRRKLELFICFSYFAKPNYNSSLTSSLNSFLIPFLNPQVNKIEYQSDWVAPNSCLILRAIPPVSVLRFFPASAIEFSKHRQAIYQNAQNYILIIVLILICPKYSSHKTR